MSVKVLTQQTPLQPKLPIPSRLCNALGADEEKRVGTHLHALYSWHTYKCTLVTGKFIVRAK